MSELVELVRRLRVLVVMNHRHYTVPGGADTGCHDKCFYASAIRDADKWLEEQEEKDGQQHTANHTDA